VFAGFSMMPGALRRTTLRRTALALLTPGFFRAARCYREPSPYA
jgi:hypothetical protein